MSKKIIFSLLNKFLTIFIRPISNQFETFMKYSYSANQVILKNHKIKCESVFIVFLTF